MKLSVTRGTEKEGDIRRAWARAVGEGPGVSLEESGGYGDMPGREAGVDVGSRENIDVTGTNDGSSLLSITN